MTYSPRHLRTNLREPCGALRGQQLRPACTSQGGEPCSWLSVCWDIYKDNLTWLKAVTPEKLGQTPSGDQTEEWLHVTGTACGLTECSLITDFSSVQDPVVEMSQLISKDITAQEKHRQNTLQPLKIRWNSVFWNGMINMYYFLNPTRRGPGHSWICPSMVWRVWFLTCRKDNHDMSSSDFEGTLMKAGNRETKERLQITVAEVSHAGLCGLRKGSHSNRNESHWATRIQGASYRD